MVIIGVRRRIAVNSELVAVKRVHSQYTPVEDSPFGCGATTSSKIPTNYIQIDSSDRTHLRFMCLHKFLGGCFLLLQFPLFCSPGAVYVVDILYTYEKRLGPLQILLLLTVFIGLDDRDAVLTFRKLCCRKFQ